MAKDYDPHNRLITSSKNLIFLHHLDIAFDLRVFHVRS